MNNTHHAVISITVLLNTPKKSKCTWGINALQIGGERNVRNEYDVCQSFKFDEVI